MTSKSDNLTKFVFIVFSVFYGENFILNLVCCRYISHKPIKNTDKICPFQNRSNRKLVKHNFHLFTETFPEIKSGQMGNFLSIWIIISIEAVDEL